MGKRLITQRRGKASPVHKSPSHRHAGASKHPAVRAGTTGEILDIFHDPGHTAPMSVVRLSTGAKVHLITAEGASVGTKIEIGSARIEAGNITYLKNIPEGTPVYNLESRPGDGGKFVRAGGNSALVVTRGQTTITVRLPSGSFKKFNPNCRATIGVVAGGGRGDKPLAKAGNAAKKVRSTGKLWPRVRGVAKNPVDHPHGGGNAHRAEGKPTTMARGPPPGRNVGHIAAKRTGKR